MSWTLYLTASFLMSSVVGKILHNRGFCLIPAGNKSLTPDMVKKTHHIERRSMISDLNLRWPGGIVPFELDAETKYYDALIREAMDEYHRKTCVRFVDHKNESLYLRIINGDGCHANAGILPITPFQEVSLNTNGCMQKGIILHELLHTLGFYHEHQRPDRDNYLIINWNNITPEFQGQFDIINATKIIDKFDYDSISMYGPNVYAIDTSIDTMVPTKPGIILVNTDVKTNLSSSDVRRINILYQCSR